VSLEKLRNSNIGPRLKAKIAGKIVKNVIEDFKTHSNSDGDLGTVLGYNFLYGKDDDKCFVRDTISNAIFLVAKTAGFKKAYTTMISEPVHNSFINTMKVPDWVQLLFKLTTKMPDRSWQTMLNFLNLGRSGVKLN
jgi:hypothetical protein